MESRDEKRIFLVEKAAETENTEDKLPWLSVHNDTLVSAAVKLMLSILVSFSISIIAFILGRDHDYVMHIMCTIYMTVILLWVSLMCVVFCRFILSGMLKEKPPHIKQCFVLGMAVNLLAVFSGVIHALNSRDYEELLFIMTLIGVFNSMVMLLFHDIKMKMEEGNLQSIYTHNI